MGIATSATRKGEHDRGARRLQTPSLLRASHGYHPRAEGSIVAVSSFRRRGPSLPEGPDRIKPHALLLEEGGKRTSLLKKRLYSLFYERSELIWFLLNHATNTRVPSSLRRPWLCWNLLGVWPQPLCPFSKEASVVGLLSGSLRPVFSAHSYPTEEVTPDAAPQRTRAMR